MSLDASCKRTLFSLPPAPRSTEHEDTARAGRLHCWAGRGRIAGQPFSDLRRRRSRQYQVRDRLSFRVALLKFVLAFSARWPSVRSARDGSTHSSGPYLARSPSAPAQSGLDNDSRASRQYPWWQPAAQSVSVFSNGSQAVSRASSQYHYSCGAPDVASADRQYPRRLTGL